MWATWDPTASLHHGHTAITSTAATGRGGEGGREGKDRQRAEIWGEEVRDMKHTDMRK